MNRTLIAACSVLVAALSIAGTQGLFCHQCTRGEWTLFCNYSANTQQCGDGDVCFSEVSNQQGILTTFKGCMPAQDCARSATTNSPHCSYGVVESQCTWCCDGNLCNYDKFSYSPTTPPPTTTTAATTTTTTSAPATLPSSCSQDDFRHCIQSYRGDVLKTLLDPGSQFSEFCRDMPSVFQCLADSAQRCGSCSLSNVLAPVLGMLQNQCPQTCNTTAGLRCTLNVQERIISVLLNVGGTCELLRREVHACYECVAFSTSSCETTSYHQYHVTVSVVEQAVELVCRGMTSTTIAPRTLPPGRPTTSTTTTTTKPIVCHIEEANRCISRLGHEIMQIRSNGGSYDRVCSELLEQTESCAREQTSGCDADIKHRVDLALQYVYTLLDGACETTTPAPVCDTTAARTCIVQLFQLVEETGDFQRACDLVESTIRCVVEKTADCTLSEKESLNKTLQIPLDRIGNRCKEPVQCPANQTIIIEEGGEAQMVEFTFNSFPTTLCKSAGCKLYVDFLPEQGMGPRCSNRKPISQLVIGAVDDTQQLPYSTKEITAGNWKDTHRFSVAAKVDFKRDGNVTREVYIVTRKVVNGVIVERRTICVVKVYIIDRDRSKNRCQILGDPHIHTFDGLLYNHYFEGFYTIYEHKSLPYQIQGVFQRCGRQGTCTCAVAVQAGDSVFVMDMCRRVEDTRRCGSRSNCGGRLKSRMFFWEKVTPGFRVFTLDGGRRIDILMPHGMKVRIGVSNYVLSSVLITPSPSDWGRTDGLCGLYDGNSANDLLLPNGDLYTGPIKRNRMPTDFCKAWSTPEDDRIYSGTPKNAYVPPIYCESRPTIDAADAAPFSLCGTDVLLELCEISTGGEITFSIPREPTVKVGLEPLTLREKRSSEDQNDFTDTFFVDIDKDFDPEDAGVSVPGDWTQIEAARFCDDYLLNQEISRRCKELPSFDANVERTSCVDDIMVTGNTSFALSALESLKQECVEEALSDMSLTGTDQGLQAIKNIKDYNCINECSGNGRCEKEKCHCVEPYAGEDCSIDKTAPVQNMEISWNGLCPTRLTDCSKVVIFGDSFINSDSLTCSLSQLQVLDEAVQEDGATISVRPIHISFNQIICPMPDDNAYHVQVSNDGQQYSDKLLFYPFDATCHECAKTENGNVACERKADSCVIDGECYAVGEKNPNDDCKVCKPSKSTSRWSIGTGGGCANTMVIVIAIVVILLLFTVIIVIAVIMFLRRRANREAARRAELEGPSPKSSHMSLRDTAPLSPKKKGENTSTFTFSLGPVYVDQADSKQAQC